MIVHYGWDDTAQDLLFDITSALIVIILGIGLPVDVAREYPHTTVAMVKSSVIVVILGSYPLAILITLNVNRTS